MRQTPDNVRQVLNDAGWTIKEAAKEIGIDPARLVDAADGFRQLPPSVWQELIDATSRA